MGLSSREKIAKCLMAFPETVELLEEHKKAYTNFVVKGANFGYDTYSKKPTWTFTVFFGDEKGLHFESAMSQRHDASNRDYAYDLVDIGAFKKIFNIHFGTKRCPTYNVNKDNADIEFYTGLRDILRSHLVDFGISKKLNDAFDEYKTRPEFAGEKESYMLMFKKKSIIEAMERFDNVSEDLLREAMEEYLTKRTLEE